ncbi:HNH endonuclease [Mycolicibacterium sediminis]|uniref:HNH endonuclease n=1 Tax=Mycolicibacterium sediminis TaxID=1286180 RepID=A0A7I7QV03_9MYCO|nr:HNH endonuclease signature motif containing protein [Mycolicibacterium sediminis]BBY29726.1 HNH endonuclease [Mycolicibacterium sediminis]
MFDMLDFDPTTVDEAGLIERIEALEKLKCTAAAAQARMTAALDGMRRAAEADRGVPAHKRGKGLASEIALARHDSPTMGGRHLGFARALIHEMPCTLAALEQGVLSEWRCTLIVRESAYLDVEDRRTLDAEMCGDLAALAGKGDTRIAAEAKKIAYRLDPHAVVDRAKKAPGERGFWIRPAADGMVWATALLPLTQGVSVYAALKREADVCGDGRGRGQVMADTLVERITGRPADVPVPVTVDLVITDETLLGGDTEPAWIPGHGPVPAAVARHLIRDAVDDRRSTATLRRLYRHPSSGALVAMESRARRFPTALGKFIEFRDDTCRTPYCNAAIRHHDHITPAARGGPTTAANGQGLCEACNYAKEAPGWHTTTQTDENGQHTTELTTPTGATHHSHAPPLPGRINGDILLMDVVRFRVAA